ncbi:hypothetical protein BDV95DRAFT_278391 [Massariosphaeria phaeospora]|uniref:Protein NO VEIN C-terminal domain-containing protein n=1 Tax=Massariosphaeria phaeospora TaxID=100035 RepID=A0A7C8MAN2_9PLEO|nr:hypothetical protein BDV95DRAFT_278391 [Massariosphaeria phaeospora]
MGDKTLSTIAKYKEVLERLGDGEPTSALEAKAVIESIRADKGHLDDETLQDLQSIRDRSRQNILRIIELKRETEAAYTKSISEQLYSSRYRFLYELVQNADDSLYSRAQQNKVVRFMRFRIAPSEMTIETNEDGFTRANVEAICATGKSSKKASVLDNHIGEKGFGFKSVFSVAENVHVQSGVWSFRFEHRRGDNGLGMVTPLEAKSETLPHGVTTKITLSFSQTTRVEYQKLLYAVAELPDTTIFFLHRLEKIIFHTTSQTYETKTIIRKLDMRPAGTVDITKTSTVRIGTEVTSESETGAYHVFTHIVNGMPYDERRKGRTTSKVELAFPIDVVTRQPKLSILGQYVFAYLPLQRLPRLNFIIQSDFITSASRESVIDCTWNDAIRDGVVKTFTQAVSTFACGTHPLRYAWLAYLPGQPIEHLWRSLYSDIIEQLRKMPVLQTWERRQWKCPHQLGRVTYEAKHNGEPLFGDLPEELYLAPEYDEQYQGTLTDLGVRVIKWGELVDRLEADIVRSDSRYRRNSPKGLWHWTCAIRLLELFDRNGLGGIKQRVRRLAIIPLTGGRRWTAVTTYQSSKIYFPTDGSVQIPEDLSLRLVDLNAASDPTRRKLFTKLGVEECPREMVLKQIEETHNRQSQPSIFGESKSRQLPGDALAWLSHFIYLFNFHPKYESIRLWLWVPTASGNLERTQSTLYFLSDKEYDAQELLPLSFATEPNDTISFIKHSLVTAGSPNDRPQNLSWVEFLQRATGARYHPSLVQKDSSGCKLSPVALAVLKHNPEKFVGLLKAHWSEYQPEIHHVSSQLSDCKVRCENGKLQSLRFCYLQTIDIQAQLQAWNLKSELSLLKLPNPILSRSDERDWQFLEDVGVRTTPVIEFYRLVLLEMFRKQTLKQEHLMEVYRCLARLASVQNQEELRRIFDEYKLIQVKARDGTRSVTLHECIWDGPDFLIKRYVVHPFYKSDTELSTLFRVFLGLRDYVVEDVLSSLNEHGNQNVEEVYKFLETTVRAAAEWKVVREAFQGKKLVRGDDGDWYTLDSCVWKTPFALSGYQDLSKTYPDLEKFFVERLKVKTASPSMLIRELKTLVMRHEPIIDEVRQRQVNIGLMLARGGTDSDVVAALDALKTIKFLPKKRKDGILELVGLDDDFAILDHERYGTALASYGVLLDFSLSESQIMDNFFQRLGLSRRYLSVAVQEVSAVGESFTESEMLGKEVRTKAYALFCCASKYKSVKALRGDRQVFDQLYQAEVYTTNDISTQLVLQLNNESLRVHSDRAYLHHEILEGQLRIYVPEDPRQRKACYRSQLPKLLASILSVSSEAIHAIALILSNPERDIDDVMLEQDIANVDWIDKLIIGGLYPTDEGPSTPQPQLDSHRDRSENEDSPESSTPSGWRSFRGAPASVASESIQSNRTLVEDDTETEFATPNIHNPPPHQYERLIEQVVRSAQRSRYRETRPHTSREGDIPSAPADDEQDVNALDHERTFGNRDGNQMGHDKRVGAAGELYVHELLAGLNLPNYTRENWRSTIRGEVQVHSRYSDMNNWVGRETTDIVYTDETGDLTQYLREHCTGGFPDGIATNRDHAAEPIEYFLEVKTTTGACNTRFYMSDSQHKRMQRLAVSVMNRPDRIYVILRVFNLASPDVDVKIFVDPLRLRGSVVDFEVGTWFGKTRDGV